MMFEAKRLLAVCVIALCAGAATAQTPPRVEIVEKEQVVADGARSDAERLAAMDRIVELRRALVSGEKGPQWGFEASQFVVAALNRLAWDGADVAAIYGVPTIAQREMATRLTTESLEVAEAAGPWLDRAIIDFEAGRASWDRAAHDFNVLTRDRLLPTLLARTLVIRAGLEAEPAPRSEFSKRAMDEVEKARFDDPAAESRRLLTAGAAMLLMGDGLAALAYFERAAPEATSNATLVEAELGRVLALVRAAGPDEAEKALADVVAAPPFVLGGKPSPTAQALATDVLFRIRMARADAAPEGAPKDKAVAQAFDVYASLPERGDLGLDAAALRSLAIQKMSAVAPADEAKLATMPAIVIVARAQALAESRATQARAARMMVELIDEEPQRFAKLGEWTPEALWLGAALSLGETSHADSGTRMRRASSMLLRLATEYPRHYRAKDAIEAACANAQQVWRSAMGVAENQDFFENTLRTAIDRFPKHPTADLWRCELGRFQNELGRWQDALRTYDEVLPDSPRAADAAFLAITCLNARMESAPTEQERTDAANRIIERLAPTQAAMTRAISMQTAVPARAAELREYNALCAIGAARAKLHVGRAQEALELADRAGTLGLETEDRRPIILGAAMALRVRALVAMDRAVEAATHAPSLANDFPASADPALPDLVGALVAEALEAEERADEQRAAEIGRDALSPAAADAAGWAVVYKSDLVDAMRIAQAQGLTLAGDGAGATTIYEDLLSRRGRENTLVLGLAEARLAASDDARAIELFREAAASFESRDDHGEGYFRAWARILEITARADGAGVQTPQLRSEIARLRLLDADLGGQPSRRRIEAVEAGL